MPATVWKALPTVLTAEEILDKGFSRGSAAGAHVIDGNRMFRNRKQMSRMVQASSEVIDSTLRNYVSKWPSLDQQSEFDVALIDAAVGVDDYRHSLGTLQWAAGQVMRIANQNRKKLRRMVEIDSMHRTRREAYGRISSIVNQVGQQLDWLNHARDTLKVLPSIDSSEPCIVVAGAPNVGKSALIAALSPAEPVVAAYPFTTRQLHVGHFDHRRRRYQLVDTPGLLDRPLEDRNPIEMQAIAALEHIGSIVLFLLDPTEHGGTGLVAQENLLEEVAEMLPQTPLMVIDAKSDLFEQPPDAEGRNPLTGHRSISSTEGFGIEELREEIVSRIAIDEQTDPLTLPEGWHRADQ